MEDSADWEDWGYGDPNAVQEVGLEQGPEANDDENIGPEGPVSRVNDDVDLSGFGDL